MQVKIKSTQYIEIYFEILGKKMYREEKKTLQKFLLNLKEYTKLHKLEERLIDGKIVYEPPNYN